MASRRTKVGHLNCGDPLADPALGEAIGPKDHHSEGVFFLAWIELHQSVVNHRKTLELADALDIEPVQALGHLASIWLWALDNAPDGTLNLVSDRALSRAAQWSGDPNALRLALVTAKYLDENGALHDWDDYAGRLIASRVLHSERNARRRQLYSDYELVNVVRQRDGNGCRYCGLTVEWKDRKSASGGTYDHVDPDGGNTAENVVVSCRGCNAKKGRRTPDQAGMRLLSQRQIENRQKTYPKSAVETENNLLPNPTVPNRTVPNRTKQSHPSHPRPVAPDADAPDALAIRQRDPLWDAFTEIFGETRGKTESQRRGEACKRAREAHATPEELLTAAGHWPNVMASATMTELGIMANLGKLLHGPQVNGRSNGTVMKHTQSLTESALITRQQNPLDVLAAHRERKALISAP